MGPDKIRLGALGIISPDMKVDRHTWLIAILFVTGCTTFTANQLEKRYGRSEAHNGMVATVPAGDVDYWRDVKPVMEQRCIVCHACYDAPCQLKMSSIEGIERGATAAKVYNQSRPKKIPTTRLFEDAQTVSEWRDKGFHPVLSEFRDSRDANREAGVMYRLLKLKEAHPLPENRVLSKDFDLSLDRKEFCAKPETIDKYERKNPLWGMPYGLPGLDDERPGDTAAMARTGCDFYASRTAASGIHRRDSDLGGVPERRFFEGTASGSLRL